MLDLNDIFNIGLLTFIAVFAFCFFYDRITKLKAKLQKPKSFWEMLQMIKSKDISAVNYKKAWQQNSHISKEDFASIPEEERVEVLYDLASFSIFSDESRSDKEKFASFSEPLKIVYSIMSFEADVNCDGLNGYFIGSHGFMAFDVLKSLNTINSREASAIFQDALKVINTAGKSESELKQAIIEEDIDELYDDSNMVKQLNDLDSKFYAMNENLSELLKAYVLQNVEEA